MESDKIAITQWITDQLARRQIVLKEKAREVLINQGIKAFRETNGNMAWMMQLIESEIALLSAIRRNHDRIIEIDELNGNLTIIERLKTFLSDAGITLRHDGSGYYIRLPRSYDIVDVQKKIKRIKKGEMLAPMKTSKTT